VKFYYAMRSCFPRGVGAGWAFGRKSNHARRYRLALARLHNSAERLKNVYIECSDFRQCIKNWDSPETFFYIDPPYEGPSYYGEFGWQDHVDLAQLLRRAKGKWLLTINDGKEMRALYRGFPVMRMRAPLAAQKVSGQRRRFMRHLVVRNYELPEAPRAKR